MKQKPDKQVVVPALVFSQVKVYYTIENATNGFDCIHQGHKENVPCEV